MTNNDKQSCIDNRYGGLVRTAISRRGLGRISSVKAVGSTPGAYRKKFSRKGISPADFTAKDDSLRKKQLFEAGPRTG
jgi:hypothetical protein